MAKKEISQDRKTLFNVGTIITFVGLFVFLSVFVSFFINFENPESMGNVHFLSMPLRGFGGIILIVVGNFIKMLAARGVAGSGLVLDPERAREELKPWSGMAGGMLNDALDEVEGLKHLNETKVKEVVKIRCSQCKTLNEEDSRFCKNCGTEI